MAVIDDLVDRLQERLEEPVGAGIFWSRDELRETIVEAMCEATLIAGEPEVRTTEIVIPADTNIVPMPPLALAITRIEAAGEVRKVFLYDLDRMIPKWQTEENAAAIKLWFPLGLNMFGVYPRLGQPQTVTVNHIAFPVTDEVPWTGQEAVPFQTEYHDGLVDLGSHTSRLKEGGLEFQQSLNAYDRFIYTMKSLSRFASRKSIERFALTSGANAKVSNVESR